MTDVTGATDAKGATALARRALRRAFRWGRHGFALVGALLLAYYAGFAYLRVPLDTTWGAMQVKPRPYNGVLVERLTYRFRAPRRWEIVAYRNSEGDGAMKRVVGLPGEKLRMGREGRVVINDNEISPPAGLDALHYIPYGNVVANLSVECGDGYYVLGDSPRDLDDSRFSGPIPREKIIGRAWVILSPGERRDWIR